MATTVLKTPPAPYIGSTAAANSSYIDSKPSFISFSKNTHGRNFHSRRCRIYHSASESRPFQLLHRFSRVLPFSSAGDNVETKTETQQEDPVQDAESEIEDSSDGAIGVEDAASESEETQAEENTSAVLTSLQLYKEALAVNDESKLVEVESFLKSIEDEKLDLEKKVATMSEELSNERERVLRISADFDNFRKRTERERLSLVTNAQGEVVENLLPVLDNFERAKAQIKVESEGEEKISKSYQSIYKQFVEILGSLGVVPVETVGKPFDPMLHEAIMREDSSEFEEGIILEEYRKGFKLGDRLLRPSMVKVSAGPGPAKPETGVPSEEPENVSASSTDGDTGAAAAEN